MKYIETFQLDNPFKAKGIVPGFIPVTKPRITVA